ncbi:MAG: tRNA (adenosine(37)-N6)-threonylcarbamoyltransferase complex ATPase subunit type 1 TsaE [Rhodobacteraceae bacterium]|nr:tRNA (adenosine(37)-N6)-threonylcarbamoyltransferase complex ATPase subunit type 1 TsaE [Paracoccaceae bacterium]
MSIKITLNSAEHTAALAGQIAPYLCAADVLLLSGDIGAGKTHFARSLIHARQEPLGLLEDVPSPTFTLVQTYPLDNVEIWHADLYRLSDVSEIIELGLQDAFQDSICLIEWPDRLADMTPHRYLALDFQQGDTDDNRVLTITPAGKWDWLSEATDV